MAIARGTRHTIPGRIAFYLSRPQTPRLPHLGDPERMCQSVGGLYTERYVGY